MRKGSGHQVYLAKAFVVQPPLYCYGSRRASCHGAVNVKRLVEQLAKYGIRAHLIRNTCNRRRSTVNTHAARSKGYALSLRVRKRVEHCLGCVMAIGDLRKLPLVELAKVNP